LQPGHSPAGDGTTRDCAAGGVVRGVLRSGAGGICDRRHPDVERDGQRTIGEMASRSLAEDVPATAEHRADAGAGGKSEEYAPVCEGGDQAVAATDVAAGGLKSSSKIRVPGSVLVGLDHYTLFTQANPRTRRFLNRNSTLGTRNSLCRLTLTEGGVGETLGERVGIVGF